MFELEDCSIPGLKRLRPRIAADTRGRFVKIVHAEFFAAHGLRCDFREQYYSTSSRWALRGLHFQVPPAEHAKLVTCIAGRIMDVVVDLRRGSPWFGRHEIFQLSAETADLLYIPVGCAHGFLTLSDSATVLYAVTSVYAPQFDRGIRWNSAGVAWPVNDPIISPRDADLPRLAEFDSPFDFDSGEMQ